MPDWLKVLAPTVASALASPLAGVAVAAVCELFGARETTAKAAKDTLAALTLTPEDRGRIRELELRLQQTEAELGLKFEELSISDRDSARNREIGAGSIVNTTLAFLVMTAFIGVSIGVIFGNVPIDAVIGGTLVGYLSAKAEQVLSYYFGSSAGSRHKTELLSRARSE